MGRKKTKEGNLYQILYKKVANKNTEFFIDFFPGVVYDKIAKYGIPN